MWKRKKESEHLYYVRSPATLYPLWSTMQGGPGIAELSPDCGLRFVGSTAHEFGWEVMESWRLDDENAKAVWIKMDVEGGHGYEVQVVPDDGALHRWTYLLPLHGIAQFKDGSLIREPVCPYCKHVVGAHGVNAHGDDYCLIDGCDCVFTRDELLNHQ
jgi:hypothetical protein